MAVTLNASTSTGYIQTADTSGDLALQSNGTTQFTVSSTGAYGQIKAGTAVASTSGTSVDFTSIPSWVRRITVMLSGASTNGTNGFSVQIGDGSFSTSGYLGSFSVVANGNITGASSTSGAGFETFPLSAAANLYYGAAVLTLLTGNTWVCNIQIAGNDNRTYFSTGSKALTSTLDRVRLTTVGTTNTFDAGTINILYEG